MVTIRNMIICLSLLSIMINFSLSEKGNQLQYENGKDMENTDDFFMNLDPTMEEDDDDTNSKWQHYQYDLEKQVEEENKNFQSKQETPQVLKYKNNVVESLMEKSIKPEEEETQNNFQSFLQTEKRGIMGFESPRIFFGHNVSSNILSLPLSGTATRKPWSSSYFPVRNGIISVRYNTNPFNTIGSVNNVGVFGRYYTLVQSINKYSQPRDHGRIVGSRAFESFVNQNYSPSEKYDLLVGDTSYTLTNFLKRRSASMATNGDVPSWFGICHGVAPATYFFNKPNRPVTVLAADGETRITFLPDDIKALASQFWAQAKYRTRFMGGRCNHTKFTPGWYSDPGCKSLNPASVVITLGNVLGRQRRNFVLDPNSDPEIWNEATYAYEMRYYNPVTNRFSGNPLASKISIGQIRSSRNAFLRKVAANATRATTHIVGVFARITYAINNQLRWGHTSNPDQSKTQGLDAVLELDRNNNIIGGEWKTDSYPNYMWRFDERYPIEGVSDRYITSYSGSASQVRSFTNYARAASNRGQPLKAIVNYFINASN